jgi:hypothetical protein
MEFLGVRWGLPQPHTATYVHMPDEPTTVVETPYILGDPFAGIGTLNFKSGPVPDLKPLAGPPEAFEGEMRIISWYSSNELAQRFGAQLPQDQPKQPREDTEES